MPAALRFAVANKLRPRQTVASQPPPPSAAAEPAITAHARSAAAAPAFTAHARSAAAEPAITTSPQGLEAHARRVEVRRGN